MNFLELVKASGLSQAEVAGVLKISQVSVSKRVNNPNSEVKEDEIRLLENATGKQIYYNSNIVSNVGYDKVEIPYYNNSNLTTNIKTDDITSIWFDRELVENIWRKKVENLRIITMLGDKMNSGSYPLRKDDILIMDISDTDITKAGVYAFTTHNDTYMFINGVNRRFDGLHRFYFYNPNYPEKFLTDEQVKTADIKIIGRIIKNLTLTI